MTNANSHSLICPHLQVHAPMDLALQPDVKFQLLTKDSWDGELLWVICTNPPCKCYSDPNSHTRVAESRDQR